MWEGGRSTVSFVLGLILIAVGLIPILNQFGVIPFGLPAFLSGLVSSIIIWLIAGSGLYLIIESFMEGLDEPSAKWLLIVGLVVLALGLIPLLNSLGVIQFTVPLLSMMLFRIIFVIEGILMIIGAFNM